MKRILIIGLIGLVVGVAGGTGGVVAFRKPPVIPVADTAHVDSTAGKDSATIVAADSAATDSAAHAAATRTAAAPTDTAHAATKGPKTTKATKATKASTAGTAPSPAARRASRTGIITASLPVDTSHQVDTARVGRLARLFSAMPARDAAKVLQQMSDGDAQLVIAAMDNRHAAEILSNFPPERVAELSKLSLRSKRP